MVILGFMLNYALRVNFTIAIVDMVLESSHDVKPSSNTNSPILNDSVAQALYSVNDTSILLNPANNVVNIIFYKIRLQTKNFVHPF